MSTSKRTFSVVRLLFLLVATSCLIPYISGGIALLFGICFSIFIGNPFLFITQKITVRLLQISVIGLGAGMNLSTIRKIGVDGLSYTALGIGLTIYLGLTLSKILKIEKNTGLLLSVGTAICGGSAIAVVASAIRAKSHEVSISLAIIFFLNATALFIFPVIGHFFNLNEIQFGLWSALAIHDTSSVIASAMQYGPKAVEIATTVKLVRALWIIPLSIGLGFVWNRKSKDFRANQVKYPWFILGFLLVAALVTEFPKLQPLGDEVSFIAKRVLVLTLFLIGSGLTRTTVQNVGFRPLIQGLLLWVIMGSATLGSILMKWIS